jgi:hypothetical protein
MRKSSVTCHECGAGFSRIELTSQPGFEGQYHCPACDAVLEAFNGCNFVAYRLTVQPSVRTLNDEAALIPFFPRQGKRSK